jgi:hypothetical protein
MIQKATEHPSHHCTENGLFSPRSQNTSKDPPRKKKKHDWLAQTVFSQENGNAKQTTQEAEISSA